VNSLTLLWAVLSAVAIALGAFLAMTLWQLRITIQNLERRLEASLRQFELTAEELRKTNMVLRQVLVRADRVAENLERTSEGVAGFGRTLGSVSSLAGYLVGPIMGKVASGVGEGILAAFSHVLNRFKRKEEKHG
jgi:hypothetical protein